MFPDPMSVSIIRGVGLLTGNYRKAWGVLGVMHHAQHWATFPGGGGGALPL